MAMITLNNKNYAGENFHGFLQIFYKLQNFSLATSFISVILSANIYNSICKKLFFILVKSKSTKFPYINIKSSEVQNFSPT